MIKKLLLVFAIIILFISACSGGTGGSVSGTRQSCQSSGGQIRCEGRIDKLTGTFSHEVETSFFREGEAVLVESHFTIESGQMQITIEAPDGTQSTAEALPGTPAVLIGMAAVESSFEENAVPLRLQAVDGAVEGISFMIFVSQP